MTTTNEGKLIHWDSVESKLVLPAQLGINQLAALIKENGWLSLPVKKVDFSQVIKADSAIFAVLLIWSSNLDEKLQVIQLPEDLQTLIKLYDLDEVLALV
ncbi:lipid asymmetry maintenance protein MlaB [Thiomicrorhabdus sp. Kp2]|uniref:STAS domain-containing protein n=1 Tax=Thiomicrorhabdus sp. Kp2 TaxID=1123518 RepID=UPI000429F884|nr:STAS domain-containing protein [Thiomicrorhabdus sp. Kp2]